MIRLASTDLLSLVTAQNGAEVIASYNDRTATAYGPGNTQVTDISSATTTTILSSPAASTVREPDEISIKNTFAGSHTMTLNFNRSATLYVVWTEILLENERIEYTHASGWRAMDANGNIKTSLAAATNWGVTGNLTVGGNTTLGDAAADSLTINAGVYSAPNQPAFLAYNSSGDANQTGNGAVATVDYDTEVFDQAGNFSADTFTAPVTGRYLLCAQVRIDSMSALMSNQAIQIVTSNRTYRCEQDIAPSGGGAAISVNICSVCDMDSGDTAFVQVVVTGGVGDTAGISGSSTLLTCFSGKQLA